LKVELKSCYFDTFELIEAESKSVLNILTEHDFQDAFENCQKHWKRHIYAEGDYIEYDLASRRKVFDRMAAPVPDIMDGSL
jgi:hypothetical protein